MRRDNNDPLSGLRATPAPPELAEPVLAAAREALAARTEQTSWDRVWNNRALRLAWAGATVVLLAAHVFVTVAPDRRAAQSARRSPAAQTDATELSAIAYLPRIEPSALGPIFQTLREPERGSPR